jgi:hypothetical protein
VGGGDGTSEWVGAQWGMSTGEGQSVESPLRSLYFTGPSTAEVELHVTFS